MSAISLLVGIRDVVNQEEMEKHCIKTLRLKWLGEGKGYVWEAACKECGWEDTKYEF